MDDYSITLVFVDNSVAMTGSARALKSIVEGLHHKFYCLIITPNSDLYRDCQGKAEIHQIPFVELSRHPRSLFYIFYLLRNTWRIHRILKGKANVILHYNDCYNLTGVVLKIMNRKRRLIYHFRLLADSYIRSLYPFLVKVIFRYADDVICNSEATCKGLPESEKKILISDAIKTPDKLPGHKNNGGIFKLLYVGNYIPGKGQDFALFCLNELRKLRADFKLQFIGGTMGSSQNEEYKSNLGKLALEMGLTDLVEFKGFSNSPTHEYRSSDILLNFSRSESFSMVCIEAMINGVNVVCLDSGGPADFVKNRVTGFLLDKDISPMGVAEVINELMTSPKLRNRIKRNAFELVQSKYDISLQLDKLEKLYATE